MANITTDSSISRRIVRSFLYFLNSVEPAAGVDIEGIEVVRECLTEVFKLDSSSVDDCLKRDSLIDIFSSLEESEHQETSKSGLGCQQKSVDAPTTSSAQGTEDAKDEESMEDFKESGVSKDELFGRFIAALERSNFFRNTPDGSDDPDLLEKASRLFNDALMEMERSGQHEFSIRNLADSLKAQGNQDLQLKLYSDAIELYSCAIALYGNNAVYYCNRAAAYTQIHKYTEAIKDCLKSIEIDPNYSKGYSRLGLAYYAQGNYRDAIEKGFKRALQLDPNNESVKENIRVTQIKLTEQQQRPIPNSDSSSSSHSNHEARGQSGSGTNFSPPSFMSIPFNIDALPADIASVYMNMASNAYQGPHPESAQHPHADGDGTNEPEIRVAGNIDLNFAEQMPQEITGALRSVMEMFSAAPGGQSQEHMHGRTAPN